MPRYWKYFGHKLKTPYERMDYANFYIFTVTRFDQMIRWNTFKLIQSAWRSKKNLTKDILALLITRVKKLPHYNNAYCRQLSNWTFWLTRPMVSEALIKLWREFSISESLTFEWTQPIRKRKSALLIFKWAWSECPKRQKDSALCSIRPWSVVQQPWTDKR